MLMQMATTIGTMTVAPQTAMALPAAAITAAPPVAPPTIPPPETTRPPPGPLRRQSGLPLPVRPSTPLRVQTPTTPVRPVGRGNGSAESTLLSSVHSTFSVASMASSVSSVEGEVSPVVGRGEVGEKVGKRDGGSVVVAQDGVVGKDGVGGRERERMVPGSEGRERTVVMTWAERARGRIRV